MTTLGGGREGGRGEIPPPSLRPTPIPSRAMMKTTNPRIWQRGRRGVTDTPR